MARVMMVGWHESAFALILSECIKSFSLVKTFGHYVRVDYGGH